jgi:hypothetical protein
MKVLEVQEEEKEQELEPEDNNESVCDSKYGNFIPTNEYEGDFKTLLWNKVPLVSKSD